VTEARAEAETGENAIDVLLRDRSGALLRTAYLLTGDRDTAADLLRRALAKTYARSRRFADVHAAEADAQRIMATLFSTWWRRRWTAGDSAPDPAGTDDDRAVLRHALAGLTRKQRAAVVLRFHAGLSEAETADALGVSVITVKSTVARAVARLQDAAPSLSPSPTVIDLDGPVAQRTPAL
jgi:RNA polymerase sigma-70 factor (sigma-E family)